MLAVGNATWWEVLAKERLRASADNDVTPSDAPLTSTPPSNSLDTPLLGPQSLCTKRTHHGDNNRRNSC